MAGLCEGGNEPPGSLKASNSVGRLAGLLIRSCVRAWVGSPFGLWFLLRFSPAVGLKPDGLWRVLGINPFDLITWLGFPRFPHQKANAGTHFDIGCHARIPTRNTILRWVASFRITGSTLKKKSPGRNSIALRLSEATVRSRALRLLSLGPFEGPVKGPDRPAEAAGGRPHAEAEVDDHPTRMEVSCG
ncbi:hypothetical protein ANN_12048 [Periplaneta americana]|uniref:Uncharacterized protein n=1 Tax=Periplaneta americana TaxID=6978 RepID=A0ABQ8T6S6_PERAM|nr:hypothetical protein ANN_12048 [Periplaneta americana]